MPFDRDGSVPRLLNTVPSRIGSRVRDACQRPTPAIIRVHRTSSPIKVAMRRFVVIYFSAFRRLGFRVSLHGYCALSKRLISWAAPRFSGL